MAHGGRPEEEVIVGQLSADVLKAREGPRDPAQAQPFHAQVVEQKREV
ncbi:MAG: hypothetical protein ACUVTQ_10120 [Desulfotomaculales bacterium]